MGEGTLKEQNAAEVISEEVLDGGCMGAAGMEHLLLYCLSSPLIPQICIWDQFF